MALTWSSLLASPTPSPPARDERSGTTTARRAHHQPDECCIHVLSLGQRPGPAEAHMFRYHRLSPPHAAPALAPTGANFFDKQGTWRTCRWHHHALRRPGPRGPGSQSNLYIWLILRARGRPDSPGEVRLGGVLPGAAGNGQAQPRPDASSWSTTRLTVFRACCNKTAVPCPPAALPVEPAPTALRLSCVVPPPGQLQAITPTRALFERQAPAASSPPAAGNRFCSATQLSRRWAFSRGSLTR